MKVLAVVQARTGSTRLPGKVMLPLGGRTLIEQMLARITQSRSLDDVVVATTPDPADDPIVDLARRAGVASFRGHPTDCLDRHYAAALERGADVVVKIPSDCPLIDPEVIDRVVRAHRSGGAIDYTSNLHPETYPDGNDVEAMTMEALEAAWREARLPHEREHTTPFLWDQPDRFVLRNVVWETGRDASLTHRVVVDYPEDYQVIRIVFDALAALPGASFGVAEIVAFLDAKPEVRLLNASRFGVTWQTREPPPLRTSETRAAEERS
jgi:spore coat polysaccharide biosynthesis protein SpsF